MKCGWVEVPFPTVWSGTVLLPPCPMATQWPRGGSCQRLPMSSLSWSYSSRHLTGPCLWAPYSALVTYTVSCLPHASSHAVHSWSRSRQRLCPEPEPSVTVASPGLSFIFEAFRDLEGQPVCKWQMPRDGQSPARGLFLEPLPELFLMVSFQP